MHGLLTLRNCKFIKKNNFNCENKKGTNILHLLLILHGSSNRVYYFLFVWIYFLSNTSKCSNHSSLLLSNVLQIPCSIYCCSSQSVFQRRDCYQVVQVRALSDHR